MNEVLAATGVTLGETVQSITPLLLVALFGLSSVLGLASLLTRLKRGTPEHFKLFVVSHMVSSWAGGCIAFVIGERYNIDDWGEIAFIMAAAYAGTRVLELTSDKVLALIPKGGRNGSPPPPPP
jgi:hypothetical protein